jgi:RNA polymerase sigma-32 factor
MSFIDTPQTQRANRRFIKSAMAEPLLDAAHEQELARRWRDHQDARALHELTQAYMRLVVSLAGRFRHYGLPMGDLIQEGNVGLMQAAARFEPDREVRFSTYASWWIRSTIQDYVLRNWSIVRTGTTAAQKSLFFNLRRLRAKIRGHVDGQLSPEAKATIARQLRVTIAEVEGMEARLTATDRSLNASIGEDGDTEWQDSLADDRPDPEDTIMTLHDTEQRSKWIARALKALNPRELTIIKERRLVDEGVTLESLGARLGISKERVRQIEHQALTKLKAALIREVGDPVAAGLAPA